MFLSYIYRKYSTAITTSICISKVKDNKILYYYASLSDIFLMKLNEMLKIRNDVYKINPFKFQEANMARKVQFSKYLRT